MEQMLREIKEEPLTILNTLESIKKNADKVANLIDSGKRVFITGSGSSYHTSLIFQLLLYKAGIFTTSVPASEFKQWIREADLPDSVTIVISQSGENADALNAAEYSKKLDSKLVCITNTQYSTLTKISDVSLVTKAGEELAICATKTYLAQLTTIYYLFGKLLDNDLEPELIKVSEIIKKTVTKDDEFAKKAAELKNKIIILGSGLLYPSSLEAGLKFREICNVMAEGYPTREFLHGPIQMVDKDTTIIMLHSHREEEETHVTERAREFGAEIMRIGVSEKNDMVIEETDELFFPMTFIAPVQLMSYYNARSKGLDPDNPEKLTKVVKYDLFFP